MLPAFLHRNFGENWLIFSVVWAVFLNMQGAVWEVFTKYDLIVVCLPFLRFLCLTIQRNQATPATWCLFGPVAQ